ncbi:Acetyltransferase (GNAT) domain-containing protein [Aquimarina amphilecti]|uniref:Acetyltransferase (GNAT) domain-containing protein n=1 Tax=Aquimarina amphilecti TaxID=1038014 RepID=A0A1H7HRC8_AQUAM|nr:GNAT family N-acetyltransferase [Aquimarina amphilecti]SEK52819.1 Acetyltransferase (GNAT) domain-containing protein [Aquimarina amphilecti]
MKKESIDYFFQLYEKCTIPKIFSELQSEKDEKPIVNQDFSNNLVENPDSLYSVFFIPDYLKPNLDTTNLTVKKVDQFFKGYAIFLNGFSSADAYIKHRFRSNAKGIRRRIKRLETCFDVKYKTYYGAIEKEEYELFMDCLEKMLVRRFEERNDVSQTLLRWDYYKKMYFSLINEKKASLFVAFNNDQPIIVSLNHHFQNRLFSAISSYDIDYSKFSLGSVEIYKKLDWLIENDHKSYEMGMGDLSYKREWCNHIYNFEHQIIYPKKSVLGYIKGNIEYAKVIIKEFIFKKTYVRYKKYKSKQKKTPVVLIDEYEVSPIEEAIYNKGLPTIDYNIDKYKGLRRIVFDFLYKSIDSVNNVQVLEVSEKENSYLIVGKSKMQKVILKS